MKTLVFLLLLVLGLICVMLGLFQIAVLGYKKVKAKECGIKKRRQSRLFFLSATCVLASLAIAFASQAAASTPRISNESANSIAVLEEVEINNRKEWISIRGKDLDNPIILFLAGGPGGTQLGAVRRNLAELEDDFVIVNWEQPGSGKSYNSLPIDEITTNTYIEDGTALTDYLLKRFNKDKIYLIGESWGSALGVFLVDKMPEKYYAFIGTGQMVAFEETEKYCYQLALEIAENNNDIGKVEELMEIGPPPYYGKNMAFKAAAYLQYLSREMAHNPSIHNAGYETIADLSSSEYGIFDQINFFRGIITTFSYVYPQLYEIDLRENYSDMNVPVYLFIGRHDINAPTHIAEDYFNKLRAPDKKLIWFENSGHNPWINESNLFCEKVVELFVQHKK